jgi:methylenetetrahydrofolate reductase (NADPH)
VALGIKRISFAAYPDGHPIIGKTVLEEVLENKLVLADKIGIQAEVVTQFCFEARPIISWLKKFRQRWPDTFVRVGLAGLTTPTALFKYAVRCGVKAPINGLGAKFAMAKNIIQMVSPENTLEEINKLPFISPHFFAFGNLIKTATWAIGLKL